MRFTAFLALFVGCATVQAQGFGFIVGDKYAQLSYVIAESTNFSGPTADVSLLYTEENDFLAHLLVLVEGDVVGEVERFNIGVGAKFGAFRLDGYSEAPDIDNSEYIGLYLRFAYLTHTTAPIQIFADVAVAPEVFSFRDLDRYTETGVGFKVQFLPSAYFVFGYKNISILPHGGKTLRLAEGEYISFGALF